MTTWKLIRTSRAVDPQQAYELYHLMDMAGLACARGDESRAITHHTDAWPLYHACGRRLGLTELETMAALKLKLREEVGCLPGVKDWYRGRVPWRHWHAFDAAAPLRACEEEFGPDVEPVARAIVPLLQELPACVLQHTLGPAMIEAALGFWKGGFPTLLVARCVIETVRRGRVPTVHYYVGPVRANPPKFLKPVAA